MERDEKNIEKLPETMGGAGRAQRRIFIGAAFAPRGLDSEEFIPQHRFLFLLLLRIKRKRNKRYCTSERVSECVRAWKKRKSERESSFVSASRLHSYSKEGTKKEKGKAAEEGLGSPFAKRRRRAGAAARGGRVRESRPSRPL